MGTGTPSGMLAEMLAAGMNAHVAGFDQAASLIEKQVLKWLKSLMGFPEAASGLLVSGGPPRTSTAFWPRERRRPAGTSARTACTRGRR